MVAAFRQHGIGQILDFVPNHMGIGGADNVWWQDVLEWGEASEYASWFANDWDPDPRTLHAKVLVPFLGAQYGEVLEAGELRLCFQPDTGDFAVWAYGHHKLPICPLHYERILGDAVPALERLGVRFPAAQLAPAHRTCCARELQGELAAQARDRTVVREALKHAVARLNGEPGRLDTWGALDALIKDQHWR